MFLFLRLGFFVEDCSSGGLLFLHFSIIRGVVFLCGLAFLLEGCFLLCLEAFSCGGLFFFWRLVDILETCFAWFSSGGLFFF